MDSHTNNAAAIVRSIRKSAELGKPVGKSRIVDCVFGLKSETAIEASPYRNLSLPGFAQAMGSLPTAQESGSICVGRDLPTNLLPFPFRDLQEFRDDGRVKLRSGHSLNFFPSQFELSGRLEWAL